MVQSVVKFGRDTIDAASLVTLGLAFVVLGFSGCLNLKQSRLGYETIVVDPVKNSSEAQKLNAEGLRLLNKCCLEEAEAMFRNALTADVDFGPAHNNLGKLYFGKRKLYLAAWEFDHAIRLMPDRAEPINNLGLVYEAIRKYELATLQFLEAHQLAPSDPQYLGNLARARFASGDRTSEMRELLEYVVFLDTRKEWLCWAEELLATAKFDTPQITIDFEGEVQSTEELPASEIDVDSALEYQDPELIWPENDGNELFPPNEPLEILEATEAPNSSRDDFKFDTTALPDYPTVVRPSFETGESSK